MTESSKRSRSFAAWPDSLIVSRASKVNNAFQL
jgi:hypothetical protein